MDHNLICSWLGLSPGAWPPDHYRLLGLSPGEDKAELIEQRVHERLDTVRRYQIMHPEQATEAMNRLAQAFVCLTEPASKKTYDRELGILKQTVAAVASAPVDALDWLSSLPLSPLPTYQATLTREPANSQHKVLSAGPPPLPASFTSNGTAAPRRPPPLPASFLTPREAEQNPAADVAQAALTPPPPPTELIDPLLEAAQSGPARRGIATKRAMFRRISRTRRLLRLWNELGRLLNSPKRRLNRATEGPQLVSLLEEITTLLRGFPPLLGEAGQPGYLVLALTQVDTIKVFQSFSAHQREALSRDWSAGLKLLSLHRDFLRQELRALRRRTLRQRLRRAIWFAFVDQPIVMLLLLALLALNLVLWRTYIEALWERIVSP